MISGERCSQAVGAQSEAGVDASGRSATVWLGRSARPQLVHVRRAEIFDSSMQRTAGHDATNGVGGAGGAFEPCLEPSCFPHFSSGRAVSHLRPAKSREAATVGEQRTAQSTVRAGLDAFDDPPGGISNGRRHRGSQVNRVGAHAWADRRASTLLVSASDRDDLRFRCAWPGLPAGGGSRALRRPRNSPIYRLTGIVPLCLRRPRRASAYSPRGSALPGKHRPSSRPAPPHSPVSSSS